MTKHEIRWIDSGREPQCPSDPAYPDGIDLLSPRHGEPGFSFCLVKLPYPARRCGLFVITCSACGRRDALTTAGRRDDPRSYEMECGG